MNVFLLLIEQSNEYERWIEVPVVSTDLAKVEKLFDEVVTKAKNESASEQENWEILEDSDWQFYAQSKDYPEEIFDVRIIEREIGVEEWGIV